MATVEHLPEERQITLHGISWDAYMMLRELPENEHVRMTFDHGDLEMMSPSRRHEQFAALIDHLIFAWAEELGIDVQNCRTMTFSRQDLQRGLEPDTCYYVQHESQVRGKRELDLGVDPPPDLAVEVDLSRSSLKKLTTYAAFGVPEVWRYDGDTLTIHALAAGRRYKRQAASAVFPRLPVPRIERVLRRLGTASDTVLVRSFREWVRKAGRRGD